MTAPTNSQTDYRRNKHRNIPADAGADSRPGEAVGVALGTSTELCSVLPQDNAEDREQLRLEQDERKYKRVKTMRRILVNEPKAKRQRYCQHRPAKDAGDEVTVMLDAGNDRAYATGLCRCGMETCAFCSWHERGVQSEEIAVAVAECQKQGGAVLFGTWSLAHLRDDKLVTTQDVLQRARHAVLSGAWWQARIEKYGIFVLQKSEETFGRHGWHPHRHDAFFMFKPPMRQRRAITCPKCQSENVTFSGSHAGCSSCGWQGAAKPSKRRESVIEQDVTEVDANEVEALEQGIRDRYLEALRRRGFDAVGEHGFHLRMGDSAMADYIAKTGHEPVQRLGYGLESEMTMGAHKKAKDEGSDKKGMTPLQLVDAAGGDGDAVARLGELLGINVIDQNYIMARAEALVLEHWRARFGKTRLKWGRGLKEELGFAEAFKAYKAKNEEIEQSRNLPEPFSFLWISGAVWSNQICGGERGRDLRAELLAEVRAGDAFALDLWLAKHRIDATIPDHARDFTLNRETAAERYETPSTPDFPAIPDTQFNQMRLPKIPEQLGRAGG